MGTSWELKGNMLGTKEKRKKPFAHPLATPTQNLKEKKSRNFECMLSLPISKTVCHHFWSGLIPPL
jgi:hypothetical protein